MKDLPTLPHTNITYVTCEPKKHVMHVRKYVRTYLLQTWHTRCFARVALKESRYQSRNYCTTYVFMSRARIGYVRTYVEFNLAPEKRSLPLQLAN